MKVQVTTSRNLRVLGERKINDKKSVWFHTEFSLPDECDLNGITAKFEGEVLQIRLPKTRTTSAAAGMQKEEGKEASANAEDKTGREEIEQEEKNKAGASAEAQGQASEGKYEKKSTRIGKMRGTLIAVIIVAVGVAITLGVRILR